MVHPQNLNPVIYSFTLDISLLCHFIDTNKKHYMSSPYYYEYMSSSKKNKTNSSLSNNI